MSSPTHDIPHLSAEDIAAEILRSPDKTVVTEWVQAVLTKLTVNNINTPKSLQEPLKAALKSLVSRTLREEETQAGNLELPNHVSLAEFIKRKLSRRSIESALSTHALPKSEGAALDHFTSHPRRKFQSFEGFSSQYEAAWFSEFGTTVKQSLQFNRARRNLSFANLESPGPARYNAKHSSFNATPSAVFPTNKLARDAYLHTEATPSPADYCPLRAFTSK